MLYTKTLALRSGWGSLSRSISSISLGIVSLWLYLLKKNDQHKIDYRITTLLGYEAFVLQIVTTCMFFRPDWRLRKFSNFLLSPRTTQQIPNKLWSEALGTFDLVAYCFKETTQSEGSIAEKIGVGEIIVEMKYVSKIPFDIRLWKFVFDELKVSLGTDIESPTINAGKAREIYEARGNLAVRRARCNDLTHFIEDYEFDSSLLMWHVATLICYHLDEASSEDESDNRKYSKIISNYMVYLMVKQPKLMSPVLGIGYDRYRETCEEMRCRGGSINPTDMKEFCVKLLAQMEDTGKERDNSKRSKSVLINSCNLTKILLNKEMKWKIISEVWVELLLFAAGHCRAESYARLLAEGGEFISFIWLLMSHLGIGPRVPVE
ncbi:hypothetical protein MLD38_017617 [Melastoma candidum]|nr:hypothetical protein MLD38_017617 [Melastoma candidum]